MIVPKMGMGTFRLTGATVIDAVQTALEVGYRAIDTAQIMAMKLKLVKPLPTVVYHIMNYF